MGFDFTDEEQARDELWLGLLVPPLVLLLAAAFERANVGHFLQRTFLSMPLHELGHAATAWLLSVSAFPGPWVTRISEEPSWGMTVVMLAAWAALGVWGRQTERTWAVAAAVPLAVLQLALRAVGIARGQAWITFGGDAGAMVIGAMLVTTFFAPPGSWPHRGWLRWGFVVIGAAGLVDAWGQWLRASRDYALIPFGEMEGVGLSDASKLVDVYGWSERQLLTRMTGLGWACMAALALIWAALALRRWREL